MYKELSLRFRVCLTSEIPTSQTSINNYIDGSSGTEITITNTNYSYLCVFYWTSSDALTEDKIFSTLNIQEGSKIISPSIVVDNEEIYNQNIMNYFTNEQVIGRWIDGRPIYRKVIDFGTLPNNTQANVNHGISNIGQVINIQGVAYSSSARYPIPLVGNSTIASGLAISIAVFNSTMRISTNADATAYSAYVILEYTKTTD